MARPSIKQAGLMKQEGLHKQNNVKRKNFWADISNVFNITKDILALKKKELKEPSADNNSLDDELAPLYLKLCDKMMPLIEPYLRLLYEQRQEQALLDGMVTKPRDKKDIN